MQESCLFCSLAGAPEDHAPVLESPRVFAFMDRSPINAGHVLVVPKRHAEAFYELEDDEYVELMRVVKRVAFAVNEAFEPKRVGMLAAGFDVPHAHVHVIPMHDYHDITSKAILDGTRAEPTPGELERDARRVREVL